MMEQFSAEDRPTDIFHTSPVMPTFSCAEQQFLKWVIMFQYKLAIPLVQYLGFFAVNLLILAEQFLTGREQNSCFSGVYICFDEMWTKCLAKCELKFYCKTSNNIK